MTHNLKGSQARRVKMFVSFYRKLSVLSVENDFIWKFSCWNIAFKMLFVHVNCQQSLLISWVLSVIAPHDLSEIILICRFGDQEAFILINVKKTCLSCLLLIEFVETDTFLINRKVKRTAFIWSIECVLSNFLFMFSVYLQKQKLLTALWPQDGSMMPGLVLELLSLFSCQHMLCCFSIITKNRKKCILGLK